MNLTKPISKSSSCWIKWTIISCGALVIGAIAALLTLAFKVLVEHCQALLFSMAQTTPALFLVFPLLGLLCIHVLRNGLFKKRKNKGITEVLDAVNRKKKLGTFKIPSHFLNGFLTVVFGGTTGIEVSTVVATATMGQLASRRNATLRPFKNEMIGAALAAGVAVLFCSPLAGLCFSYETVKQQHSKIFFLTHLISVGAAMGVMLIFGADSAFVSAEKIVGWHWQALPYFGILAIAAALYSVYLTRVVLWVKKQLPLKSKPGFQLVLGALILGICLWLLPAVYGDGYHSIHRLLQLTPAEPLPLSFALMALLLLVKPGLTGLTLALGGDGGVFAPSIFAGALLGLMVGLLVQSCGLAEVYLINFTVVGIAVTVSATLHAPWTAVFLACGLFGTYALCIPLVMAVFISKALAHYLYPYTVYNQPTGH